MIARRVVSALLAFLAFTVPASAQWPSTRANQLLNAMFTQGAFGFGFPPYAADPFACNTTTKRTTYYNTTSNTALFCNGSAWTGLGGASLSATNDWTQPQRFADGTASVPSIAWTSDADGTGTGFYRRGAVEITATFNGVGGPRITQFGFHANATQTIGFASGAVGTSDDVIFARDAAAVFQLGNDVNGSAIAQTIKAHDGITGTDIAGASLTLGPGKGTGAAVSGAAILNRNLVGATGTTPQTQAPSYISCPTKILSNTSATAQTMATITTTSTTGGAVKMFFTVVANNGTLQDTDAGEIVMGWRNNAGTVAAAASAIYGQMDSDASGTLATTPTVTVATNVVSVKFTPTWVTIVPTTVTGFATFEVNGVNSVACQ